MLPAPPSSDIENSHHASFIPSSYPPYSAGESQALDFSCSEYNKLRNEAPAAAAAAASLQVRHLLQDIK